jgi:nucleoside-diphosphate-sugar epimerase
MFPDEAALEDALSCPTPALWEDAKHLHGDLLILGVGGKMGPTLARMARRVLPDSQRVITVARFSQPAVREALERQGIETIAADLTDREAIASLPDAPNIVYMAGQKFGTTDAPEQTWLMNATVPGFVAERFAPTLARMVVFSTGCVYPYVSLASGGSVETDDLTPLGEYANSCVARERVFAWYAQKHHAPLLLFRLNYAVDLRYGVLVDIAQRVWRGQTVDVTMGYTNVIWQGDANALALRSLLLADTPPVALNVTGAEILRIRDIATFFGERFGKPAQIVGQEAETALLSNVGKETTLLGKPTVSTETLLRWVAEWTRRGGRTLGKPTHYEVRDGRY